ncbi:MAG: hypothetical protein IKE91_01215 [Clostridia bacterium]|nr:hypothetical protein [Clostridia bacterium]
MENEERVALGVTAMIFGIISLATMCFIVISVFFGILAIIFGILSIIFEKKNKLKITGLVLGLISITITIVLFLVLEVWDLNIFMVPKWYI